MNDQEKNKILEENLYNKDIQFGSSLVYKNGERR